MTETYELIELVISSQLLLHVGLVDYWPVRCVRPLSNCLSSFGSLENGWKQRRSQLEESCYLQILVTLRFENEALESHWCDCSIVHCVHYKQCVLFSEYRDLLASFLSTHALEG